MAPPDPIITQEQLAAATGYRRAADIKRCLERQGITVRTGRGGRVWTTLSALDGRLDVPPGPAAIDFV